MVKAKEVAKKPEVKIHSVSYRVYYEDTDAGGVTYHASYIRFAERARTEMLRTLGYGQKQMREKDGVLFVVRFLEAEYLKPAHLDDMLHIESCVESMSRTSMVLLQKVYRVKELLCAMRVVIICVSKEMKPIRIPPTLKTKLESMQCVV